MHRWQYHGPNYNNYFAARKTYEPKAFANGLWKPQASTCLSIYRNLAACFNWYNERRDMYIQYTLKIFKKTS